MQWRNIIYLDESWFALDSPRTHWYSKIGKRCFWEKAWNSKWRINAIWAIIWFVFLTVCLFDCNIDSDIFYSWLTKDLLPKTPENSVIVMDNASFHKRSDMKEAILEKWHTPIYLPPYSPDLNPIEHKWAQSKNVRKKLECCVEEVFSYI